MSVSASQIVRDALDEWARGLMAEFLPEATVEGGPVDAGQAPPLPTLGLDWGATEVLHARPYDVESYADGRGVWQIQYEDVALAFVWRAATPEDADYFAHEFATRAALQAVRSNDDGNRVLHFAVQVGELERTAKLYLGGEVVPVKPEENATRSLYTYRVPGSVSYPVIRIEDLGDATGLMNVIVTINGTSYALADIVPEA